MNNKTFMRLIVSTSLITVVLLTSFIIFYLSPAFTRLIIKNTELEAVKVAQHLAEIFIDQGHPISSELPPGFSEQISLAVTDFNLMKIKIFDPGGKVVYSTDPKDIGKINKHDYFHDIVAHGQVFTKVVQKNQLSMEEQVMLVDVVETYVPIKHHLAEFAGAFEVYLDITDKKKELGGLLFRTQALVLTIAGGLLLALLVISAMARRSFLLQEQAEQRIIKQSLDLQEKNSELAVLNDISETLSTSIDLDILLPKVLATIVDRLTPVLRLEHKGGIFLIHGDRMELVSHLGHTQEFIDLHANMTVKDCLCGLVARTGKVIVSHNSNEDCRHTISYPGMAPHGHIIVPLISANKVIGVFYSYLPANVEVSQDKKDLLHNIGNQLGIAIDNARLYEKTKELSLHDHLTGLPNRRFMDINLQRAVALATRYKTPLCIAMFDIDFFKQYNDAEGHDAGDKLLMRIAKKIAAGCRDSDMVARFGGEEFLLILPEAELNQARLAVDRIREDIAGSCDVTISAGVTLYQKDSSVEELIKTADQALYQAKEKGRNRVECA